MTHLCLEILQPYREHKVTYYIWPLNKPRDLETRLVSYPMVVNYLKYVDFYQLLLNPTNVEDTFAILKLRYYYVIMTSLYLNMFLFH